MERENIWDIFKDVCIEWQHLDSFIIKIVQEEVERVLGNEWRWKTEEIMNSIRWNLKIRLIESNLRYRAIMNSLPEFAINLQDENHIILDCNHAYVNLVWFPREEIIWKSCTDVLCTWDKCNWACPIELIKTWERKCFLSDMETRVHEKRAETVYDDFWNFIWYVEIYQDVTEKINKERELIEAYKQISIWKAFLESALENSRQWIWEWDMQTWQVKADRNFYVILWYDPDTTSMTYEFWDSILHPEDKIVVKDAIFKHSSWLTKHFQFHYRLKHSSWEYIWLNATWKIVEVDMHWEPKRAIWTHMDITEMTNLKNFLLANEQKLQAIISSIPDLLLILDRNWNYKEIYSWNPAYYIWARKVWSNISNVFDEQTAKAIMNQITEAVEKKWVEEISYSVEDKKWNKHFFRWNIRALNDDEIIIITRDVTEEKLKEDRNEFLAMHDSLTSLPNRAYFNEELTRSISIANRNNTRIWVIYLDLDRFKLINDHYWHDQWDLLLIETAKRIKSVMRNSDIVARLWWDEFWIIINWFNHISDIDEICERVRSIINAPFHIGWNEYSVWASTWVSLFPQDWKDTVELQKKADQAMYISKWLWKNRSSYFKKPKA